MKTDFEAWVVLKKGTKPLEKIFLQGDLTDALLQATSKLRAMGARIAEIRNLSNFRKHPSMLVYDPSFPVAVIIVGAQLTDSQGNPLVGDQACTGLTAIVPAICE